MTPFFLNPPPSPFQLVDQKDGDEFQRSDHHEPPSDRLQQASQQHQFKVDQIQYSSDHHRPSDVQVFSSSSSSSVPKWMSSKMRLMQKMMNTNCTTTATDEPEKIMQRLQWRIQESNDKTTVRACADCSTTTTPLWRSGPRGPKSLCNACGIRQRKARRAMEAAAAAAAAGGGGKGTTAVAATADMAGSTKKSRTSHVGQYKKQCKPQEEDPSRAAEMSRRSICFKDFAMSLSENSSAIKQVITKDMEEAAILLMELSCSGGFIQS